MVRGTSCGMIHRATETGHHRDAVEQPPSPGSCGPCTTACWIRRSGTVGPPGGRPPPDAVGISARRTSCGSQAPPSSRDLIPGRWLPRRGPGPSTPGAPRLCRTCASACPGLPGVRGQHGPCGLRSLGPQRSGLHPRCRLRGRFQLDLLPPGPHARTVLIARSVVRTVAGPLTAAPSAGFRAAIATLAGPLSPGSAGRGADLPRSDRPPSRPGRRNCRPGALMAVDFAIIGSLVRPGRAPHPFLVHRVAAVLHAPFRLRVNWGRKVLICWDRKIPTWGMASSPQARGKAAALGRRRMR